MGPHVVVCAYRHQRFVVRDRGKRSAIQVSMVSLDAMHDCKHLTLDIAILAFSNRKLQVSASRQSELVQLGNSVNMRSQRWHVSARQNSSGGLHPTPMSPPSLRVLVVCVLSLRSVKRIVRDTSSSP